MLETDHSAVAHEIAAVRAVIWAAGVMGKAEIPAGCASGGSGSTLQRAQIDHCNFACRRLPETVTSYVDHYPPHPVGPACAHHEERPPMLPFDADSTYQREFGWKERSPADSAATPAADDIAKEAPTRHIPFMVRSAAQACTPC